MVALYLTLQTADFLNAAVVIAGETLMSSMGSERK